MNIVHRIACLLYVTAVFIHWNSSGQTKPELLKLTESGSTQEK